MNFKVLLVNMALIGILTFSIFAFIIQTQVDNDVEDSYRLTNDTRISTVYSQLEDDFQTYKDNAESSEGNFSVVPPTQQYGELEVTSIFSLTKTAQIIIKGFWKTIIILPQSILGVPSSIVGIFGAILVIFIVIGVWAIWKGVIS